jgi:acetamidase/formamidase
VLTAPSIHVTRDRYHLAWDPAIEPIETVDQGAVVEFDLLDASCGQLDADCGVPQLLSLDFDRVDQVVGPIAVAGAERGDTLQVDPRTGAGPRSSPASGCSPMSSRSRRTT